MSIDDVTSGDLWVVSELEAPYTNHLRMFTELSFVHESVVKLFPGDHFVVLGLGETKSSFSEAWTAQWVLVLHSNTCRLGWLNRAYFSQNAGMLERISTV